ncbi:glycoside hydrolase family 13 protein [Paenibacillus phocaensis]|uniref:glycoside hydrolase family 13 protein n=1 Tax=Paenibacillus phocaensis TaxID=1776378 RepID=UPI000839BC71|nr:alpha-glucosidase [Paenibacillus phocaensis]
MEKTWWKESVVYQIYPRSFKDSNDDGIGDLNGITEKLDYLKLLGIDVIWLCPVYKSPNCDNGYDISDYHEIMNDFGTMEDFDRLLEGAHSRGIKIIMDLVVNHTSDEHPWFVESKKSVDNPYRDFYIWREGKDGRAPNNWGSWFGGSAWNYSPETDSYYLHIFADKQPDLNWENEHVRKEVIRLMKWWCDKGIDGFRLDVISMISKTKEMPDGHITEGMKYGDLSPYVIHGPRVHEYLRELNREVFSQYDVMTVGETAGVTVEHAKEYAGFERNELNMIFQFEHMDLDFGEKNKWNDQPPKLTDLKAVLSKWQVGLHNKAWNSLFWDNHDQPRALSRFGNDKEYWAESAKMLATCLHMMQGTPYIYQGDEIGMTNIKFTSIEQYRDIESHNAYEELVGGGLVDKEQMLSYLNYKSRDNARTPMQWDASKNAGFTNGEPWIEVNPNYLSINAATQVTDKNSIFAYYQKLIRLRKQHEIIVYGSYELLLPESEELFVYTRTLDNQKLLVMCNFTDQIVDFAIPDELQKCQREVWIHNYPDVATGNHIKLRPHEAVVLFFADSVANGGD